MEYLICENANTTANPLSRLCPTRISPTGDVVHSTATLPGRPDGVGSITVQEKEKFAEIKDRLKALLQHQITNFRYAFPFGRPEGALKVNVICLIMS